MQQAVDIAMRGACHGGDAEQTNKTKRRFAPRPRALRLGERSGSMRIGRGFARQAALRRRRRMQHAVDIAGSAHVAAMTPN